MSSIRTGFACLLRCWQLQESELKAYLRRRVPTDALADDMMQDVFVNACARAERFAGSTTRASGCSRWRLTRWWTISAGTRVNGPLCEAMHEAIAEETSEAQASVDALSGCLDRALSE